MLDSSTLNEFIRKANPAHQQFCVWFDANNEFVKHQARWNELDPDIGPFGLENFTKRHDCKYKNFWGITITTIQHGWILSTARLFDPAYNSRDKEKARPRMSLDYILIKLEDEILSSKIREELKSHELVIKSIRDHRNNVFAHNDVIFSSNGIESGVENLFQWLEDTIEKIKKAKPCLNNCGIINIKYNEVLSKSGVDEIFENLLLGEKYKKLGWLRKMLVFLFS